MFRIQYDEINPAKSNLLPHKNQPSIPSNHGFGDPACASKVIRPTYLSAVRTNLRSDDWTIGQSLSDFPIRPIGRCRFVKLSFVYDDPVIFRRGRSPPGALRGEVV